MTENVPVFDPPAVPVAENYTSMQVTIEAVQLTEESYFRIFDWIQEHRGEGSVSEARDNIGGTWHTDGLFIPTPEGPMRARFGDWIIRGTVGEFYPCMDKVFKVKYRKVSTEKPDTKLLQSSIDAAAWAGEFMKVNPGADEGAMIGWFANAIEVAKASAKAAK